MYRILEPDGATRERRDQLTHPAYQKPESWGFIPSTGVEFIKQWTPRAVRCLAQESPARPAPTITTSGIKEARPGNFHRAAFHAEEVTSSA